MGFVDKNSLATFKNCPTVFTAVMVSEANFNTFTAARAVPTPMSTPLMVSPLSITHWAAWLARSIPRARPWSNCWAKRVMVPSWDHCSKRCIRLSARWLSQSSADPDRKLPSSWAPSSCQMEFLAVWAAEPSLAVTVFTASWLALAWTNCSLLR